MIGLLAVICAGIATSLVILTPYLLRSRTPVDGVRDSAWRDQLPAMLRLMRPLVRAYAAGVESGMDVHKRELLQGRLNAAGAAYLITPAEFMVIRRVAMIIGLGVAMYVIFALHVTKPIYIAGLMLLGPGGYLYPDIWLRDATKNRHHKFAKEFPFLLDVLVLCMRAGLPFSAAVEQAVEQLTDGPVKHEFARFLRETRTGMTRRVALDRLAARVMLPSVTNFVASVGQAEETGGSLGDILADQSRQRRQERFLRAEKLANQAPVKMLFPLIAFLFPITFIVIGFAVVMQLMDSGSLGLLTK
jgi:tight adherence protein C